MSIESMIKMDSPVTAAYIRATCAQLGLNPVQNLVYIATSETYDPKTRFLATAKLCDLISEKTQEEEKKTAPYNFINFPRKKGKKGNK